MIKDGVIDRNSVTLLSLMADNSGKFDICALIYDLCTGNRCLYYDEKLDIEVTQDAISRMVEVKEVSENAYIDLKRIVSIIKQLYVSDEKADGILVVRPYDYKEAVYVSPRFDDVFIKRRVEDYYHGNFADMSMGGFLGKC